LLFVLTGAFLDVLPISLDCHGLIMQVGGTLICIFLCMMIYLHVNVVLSEFTQILAIITSCCHDIHMTLCHYNRMSCCPCACHEGK
jgi:hypothetical protein